ncbi:MAG: hypothetical protein WC028_07385 [Candidatus Obscuribacterales bacterium]
MIKRLFPQFPLSQSAATDPALDHILGRYGSWLHLLDPTKEVPESLSEELKRIGYSIEELIALRVMTGGNERQRLVLRAACLRKRMSSEGDVRLPSLEYEALNHEITKHGIDEAEVEYAVNHFVPFVEGWRL